MYKTAQQLIREAHEVANSLPPASAAILKEVASRLDVSVAALIQVCDERSTAINTITATRVNSGCPEGVDVQDWVKRLVTENLGLKAGASYFSYGSECGFEWHKTENEAVEAAESAIDDYRGDACDGWSEEVDSICLGIIMRSSTKVGERPRNEDDSCDPSIDTVCDYALLPNIETPATDRIVSGIKAGAFEEAAVELERVDTIASTRVIALKLREFAKQLREVSANG